MNESAGIVRKPRCVVFDLDGTLIDSSGDIAAATLDALRTHGFPEIPRETLLTYVGDGAQLLLMRSAGIGADDPRLDPLYETFLASYDAHPVVHTTFCRGAMQALSALSEVPGLSLALCTNKPRTTTERVLDALQIRQRFALVIAGGDLPLNKPDPLPLLQIAQRLCVDPAQIVMVGDGAQDVLCGRAAGARSVGVRGGIQPIERLLAAKPEVLLDTLEQLPQLIAEWSHAAA